MNHFYKRKLKDISSDFSDQISNFVVLTYVGNIKRIDKNVQRKLNSFSRYICLTFLLDWLTNPTEYHLLVSTKIKMHSIHANVDTQTGNTKKNKANIV